MLILFMNSLRKESTLFKKKTNEPSHDKTNKMACVPSEDSDQRGHPLCAQRVAKDPMILHADSEDSDQTARMRRLIYTFVVCIWQK